jgi:hypothetical protein
VEARTKLVGSLIIALLSTAGHVVYVYLDEAIMEEHPDNGSTVSGVQTDGLLHDSLDDGLSLGTLVVVITHLQGVVRAGVARHSKEQQCNRGEIRSTGHVCCKKLSIPRHCRLSKKQKNVKIDEEELLQRQAIYGLKRANIDLVSVQKYTQHVCRPCAYNLHIKVW